MAKYKKEAGFEKAADRLHMKQNTDIYKHPLGRELAIAKPALGKKKSVKPVKKENPLWSKPLWEQSALEYPTLEQTAPNNLLWDSPLWAAALPDMQF